MERKGVQKAAEFIRGKGLLQRGNRVLIACSGGVDSMVLLHFMASCREDFGIQLGAVHVDHCLRGDESAEDGAAVKRLAARLGVPCRLTAVPVPEILQESGGNVQDVCRTGRYERFTEVMAQEDYQVLAAAHHAEDQLETVLMQLAKGQRPKGMPSMRPFGGGTLIRPFLPLEKAELYTYAAEYGISFREDPSNRKDDYTRNRYRHHILPALLAEEPAAAVQSVRMAETIQEEDALLDGLAQEQAEQLLQGRGNGELSIDAASFSSMHPALQKRVVPLLLKYLYHGETIPAIYNASLVNQVVHQLSGMHGSRTVHLPKGWQLVRTYGRSVFVRDEAEDPVPGPADFPENRWVRWGGFRLRWCRSEEASAKELADVSEWRYFQLAGDVQPALIRSRQPGDRILLKGMAEPKKLRRLFIDAKVGQQQRGGLPVIVTDDGGICAVPGVRYGDGFTKEKPDGEAYILMTDRLDGRFPPAAR